MARTNGELDFLPPGGGPRLRSVALWKEARVRAQHTSITSGRA